MKYIANILTEKPFGDDELYNVVRDKNNLITGIPTLIIGWEFTKTMYPNANIIDWQIEDGVYWTFGNRERRSVFENRCQKFKTMAMENFIHSVKYEYFSVLTNGNERKEQFFREIRMETGIRVYIYNNMVYVYVPSKNIVYGIFLNDITYMGKSAKRFLGDLHKNENIEFVNLPDNISQETKYTLRNYNYIIPCLLS